MATRSSNVYSKLVQSYARALFEASVENNMLESISKEFESIAKIDFKELNSPLVSEEQKNQVVDMTLKDKVSEAMLNFIKILIANNRLKYLFDIKEAFGLFIDKHANVARGSINIAQIPDEESKKIIVDSLGKITGKKVMADFVESPELIAGFKTFLGSYYIDYSLLSHIQSLENELKRSSWYGKS